MKNTLRKYTAMLLTLIMVLNILPLPTLAEEPVEDPTQSQQIEYKLLKSAADPVPVDLSVQGDTILSNNYYLAKTNTNGEVIGYGQLTNPSSFSFTWPTSEYTNDLYDYNGLYIFFTDNPVNLQNQSVSGLSSWIQNAGISTGTVLFKDYTFNCSNNEVNGRIERTIQVANAPEKSVKISYYLDENGTPDTNLDLVGAYYVLATQHSINNVKGYAKINPNADTGIGTASGFKSTSENTMVWPDQGLSFIVVKYSNTGEASNYNDLNQHKTNWENGVLGDYIYSTISTEPDAQNVYTGTAVKRALYSASIKYFDLDGELDTSANPGDNLYLVAIKSDSAFGFAPINISGGQETVLSASFTYDGSGKKLYDADGLKIVHYRGEKTASQITLSDLSNNVDTITNGGSYGQYSYTIPSQATDNVFSIVANKIASYEVRIQFEGTDGQPYSLTADEASALNAGNYYLFLNTYGVEAKDDIFYYVQAQLNSFTGSSSEKSSLFTTLEFTNTEPKTISYTPGRAMNVYLTKNSPQVELNDNEPHKKGELKSDNNVLKVGDAFGDGFAVSAIEHDLNNGITTITVKKTNPYAYTVKEKAGGISILTVITQTTGIFFPR